jgi:hypothetical protein
VTTFGLSFRTERADAGKVSYPDSAAANVPWVTASRCVVTSRRSRRPAELREGQSAVAAQRWVVGGAGASWVVRRGSCQLAIDQDVPGLATEVRRLAMSTTTRPSMSPKSPQDLTPGQPDANLGHLAIGAERVERPERER